MVKIQDTYIKLIKCTIILIVFTLLTIIIKYYFTPFFIIIFMLFLCKPIFDLLCNLNIFNKNINAIISVLLINLIIFFITIYTGKVVINKIYFFIHQNYNDLTTQLQNIVETFNKSFNLNILNIDNEIKNFHSKITYNSYIKRGAVYTTQGIFAYFISNIAVYFILVDKYVIVKTIEKLTSSEKLINLKNKMVQINRIFKIELILVLITTLETIFGFMALDIDNALFLSLLCGLFDLIPYIGTIVIFIPLIIYNFITNNKIIAIGLIILYILLQITRQIAEAKFVSDKLKIHPLIILLSLYLGIRAFGVIGLFMAPLYIIITKEIIFST